jgi:ABC-2 type transport system permease protein
MFVNDGIWLAYWAVFFTQFPVLNGWVITDVVTMWAVVATGFGLATGFMGNTLGLARLIAEGQLDAWLLYPRQPWHICFSAG